MKYSGIDLHSNNCVVVVTDGQDHVLEEKRVPNDLVVILKLLEPHREDLAGVVVESTFNWYWLVDGLMEAGYAVKLANPAAMKPMPATWPSWCATGPCTSCRWKTSPRASSVPA